MTSQGQIFCLSGSQLCSKCQTPPYLIHLIRYQFYQLPVYYQAEIMLQHAIAFNIYP